MWSIIILYYIIADADQAIMGGGSREHSWLFIRFGVSTLGVARVIQNIGDLQNFKKKQMEQNVLPIIEFIIM